MRRQLVAATGAAILSIATLAAQSRPEPHELTGGGSLMLRRDGDRLMITLTGPRAGLASLCLGDQSRVRILHASAALAEAVYEKAGTTWTLSSGFGAFELRDTRTGPPPEADRAAFFVKKGWLANASNAGTIPREFTIRIDSRARFLGVAFYTTEAPEAVTYWPATMSDDCRAVKVAQGFLPATAEFRPDWWYPIR